MVENEYLNVEKTAPRHDLHKHKPCDSTVILFETFMNPVMWPQSVSVSVPAEISKGPFAEIFVDLIVHASSL